MEAFFDDQHLALRISAERIVNKSYNQNISQPNGCLLINAESRRYGTAGTTNGANIVLLSGVISCSRDRGVCCREKEKNPLMVSCNAKIGAASIILSLLS